VNVQPASAVKEASARFAVVAAILMLPLLLQGWLDGWRVATSDPVLGTFNPSEGPLSVGAPAGAWAVALAAGWYVLAYRGRSMRWWEPLLVVGGGAIALARVGNLWVLGVLLLLPLSRQLARVRFRQRAVVFAVAILMALAVTIATLMSARPPALDQGALEAIRNNPAQGAVFTDWRWAPSLRRDLGTDQPVLPSQEVSAASEDSWVDYLRISQGNERWAALLQSQGVNLLVLTADGDQRPLATLVKSSPDWRILYQSPGVLVAQRVTA
jgi:hypothetical protein